MADIIKYDTVTNWAKQYIPSQDPSGYVGQNDVLIFEDTTPQTVEQLRTLIGTVPVKYLIVIGNPQVREMTIQEKAAVDAAIAAALLAERRLGAKNLFDAIDLYGRILRAVVALVVDEINILRQRDRDRAVDVAAATTLADLKTRWAARSSLADRTYAQARTAIRNFINGEN